MVIVLGAAVLRARRRRRAGVRRRRSGPGRRPPGGGRAAADRAGGRALDAHPARAALHAGAAAVRAAGGVHVGRAGPRRGGGLRGRHRRARRGGRARSPRRASTSAPRGSTTAPGPARRFPSTSTPSTGTRPTARCAGPRPATRCSRSRPARPAATTGRPRISTRSTATAGSPGSAATAAAARAQRGRPRALDADAACLDRRHEDHRRDRGGLCRPAVADQLERHRPGHRRGARGSRPPWARARTTRSRPTRRTRSTHELADGWARLPGGRCSPNYLTLRLPVGTASGRRGRRRSPSRCFTRTADRGCRPATHRSPRGHPRGPNAVGCQQRRSVSRRTRGPTRWPAGWPAKARTPYAFVMSVRNWLTAAHGFSYTQNPAQAPVPAGELPLHRQAGLLPAVLRRDGAAAADGRDPRPRGRRLHPRAPMTRSARRWIVTDIDAHAWVEAWFPELRLGALRSDAEHRARARLAPPSSRSSRRCRAAAPALGRGPGARREAGSTAAAAQALRHRGGGGTSLWWLIPIVIALVVVAGLGGCAASLAMHIARTDLLAELERALARTGRPLQDGITLGGPGAAPAQLAGRRGLRARAAAVALRRPAPGRPTPRSGGRCAGSWGAGSGSSGASARCGRCRRGCSATRQTAGPPDGL